MNDAVKTLLKKKDKEIVGEKEDNSRKESLDNEVRRPEGSYIPEKNEEKAANIDILLSRLENLRVSPTNDNLEDLKSIADVIKSDIKAERQTPNNDLPNKDADSCK